jgi:uncharacterized protein YndB with AHSA1/START domain
MRTTAGSSRQRTGRWRNTDTIFASAGAKAAVAARTARPSISNETVYLDIVENRRIISAYTMAKDDRRISASIATVDLVPEGSGTRVVFTEQAAFLDGLDKVEYRRSGWEQLIGFLAAELGEKAEAA